MNLAMVGVPAAARARVTDRYTIPGSRATAVSRYEFDEGRDLSDAIIAVRGSLAGAPQNAVTNVYHRALGVDAYETAALGDTDWGDVVKIFAGQVGAGIAQKIGGHGPAPVTVVQTPAPKKFPTAILAAAGAGAGLLLYLLLRRR